MILTQSRLVRFSIILTAVLILAATPGLADEVEKATNPLDPLSILVGGEWHLKDNYHVMDWGLGKVSVTVKSYFVVEGKPMLVSDGFWF